jgi:hypothetical protein
MKSDDISLAPPIKIVDRLTAVPIDIYKLNAKVIFDLSVRKCKVNSSMYFSMGNQSGNPLFDLRQDIYKAHLNGKNISNDKLRHHDFGNGPLSALRILEENLDAKSDNILNLEYELKQPQSLNSNPIGWNSDSLYFDFWFSDLWPARYLEMWFPSNLIYDRFGFNLTIQIINTKNEHILFSNGKINKIGDNSWEIDFPDKYTSLSHMLYICPKSESEIINDVLILPDSGKNLYLDVFKLKKNPSNLVVILNKIKRYLSENVLNIGPYIHENKFTCFLWESPDGRSMEYDGAITTTEDALKHEVFHSWFARGVKPASQNDAWFDEGWTVYNTDETFQLIKPLSMSEPPVLLSSLDPFNRITPRNSYINGGRFFAGLAAELGYQNLNSYMNSFYKEHTGIPTTTKKLESYLIEQSGKNIIKLYFNRFVYGQTENN